jgi:hypothetical protein
MQMATTRRAGKPAKRERSHRLKPGDDPDVIRRVAMHVALALECKRWLDRSIELNYHGKVREAAAATAKARVYMDQMREIERMQ